IALAMALCRQLFPLDQEAKQLGWIIRVEPRLRRLRELTFGVVGLGRIGAARKGARVQGRLLRSVSAERRGQSRGPLARAHARRTARKGRRALAALPA